MRRINISASQTDAGSPRTLADCRRIVVVSHNAFPAVFPRLGRLVGGSETWAWMLAKGLNQGPQEVWFYLRHTTPLPAKVKEGVRLAVRLDRWRAVRHYVSECCEFEPATGRRKLSRWRAGLIWRVPLLLLQRPFRRQPPAPLQPDPELARLAADAYIALGVGPDSSTVIATARQQGKPSLLLLVSNADVAREFATQEDYRDRYGVSSEIARYLLQQATHVVCQSRWQEQQLRQYFGREGSYLPPPVDLTTPAPSSRRRNYVLWMGRADRFHKRPLLGLEVARRLPEIPFLMVMNQGDLAVSEQVRDTLPPNVTFREYVPYDEIPALFAGAAAYLSTGSAEFEGFPLVLLHAAAAATPIVSMHDFDGFIRASGAGWMGGENLAALAELVAQTVRGERTTDASAVRHYLRQHHDLEGYVQRLTRLPLGSSSSAP